MRVTALVAAYNEESTVAAVVAGALRHVAEVVVVDDGSRDRTAERAQASGATVLLHATNQGKGVAVRTGIEHALRGPATHLLFLDADGQHAPDDIPALVAAAARGAGDFVVAERSFRREAMPGARFYANTIGSRIMSMLIGTSIRDSQSGFRLIRAELLRGVTLTARRYEIETEILIKLARRGARMQRVEVVARYGGACSKMRPVRDVFRICMLAMRYRYFSGERAAAAPRGTA